jgi:transcriptional regulator NrdR family protein
MDLYLNHNKKVESIDNTAYGRYCGILQDFRDINDGFSTILKKRHYC